MATESFARQIIISDPESIKKIHAGLKSNATNGFKCSVHDINESKPSNRKTLAEKITSKY